MSQQEGEPGIFRNPEPSDDKFVDSFIVNVEGVECVELAWRQRGSFLYLSLEDLVVWLAKNRIELLLTKINESGRFCIYPGTGQPVVFRFLQPEDIQFGGTAPGEKDGS